MKIVINFLSSAATIGELAKIKFSLNQGDFIKVLGRVSKRANTIIINSTICKYNLKSYNRLGCT